MKHMKKLAGILLALVMALTLAVPAFAATVSVPSDGILKDHAFTAYQIFSGREDDGVLSDVQWGSGIKSADFLTALQGDAAYGSLFTGCATAADVAKVLGDNNTNSGLADRFAELAYANTTGTGTALTAGENTLADGYYLIVDTTANVGEGGAYNKALLEVVGDIEITVKTDAPTVEKKIVEGEKKVDVNEASIGDTVSYEITGTLPGNLADYNTYYYVFTDTLSKGLTFNDDVKVEVVNGGTSVDVTDYFYISATNYSETDGTVITVGIQDLLALNNLGSVTVDKDSKIVITYTATLNENAVIAGAGNPNDVQLKYSNDPNNSGDGTTTPPPQNPGKPEPTHPTGDTPKDTVVTFTTELTILKHDEKGNILPGAEFTLTGDGVNVVLVTTETFTADADGDYWKLADGTYTKTAPTEDTAADYDSTDTKYTKTVEIVAKGTGKTETVVVGTVDSETGTVTFTGLGAGTYTITETKTPAGYNTIEPITFTITFDAGTKTFASDNANVVVGADNKLDTTIINQSGATLPETGGVGTTLFYVLGAILVLGAGVLLVAKKRMSTGK